MDFIGIGAQKAATSWVYACLYEHPEICAPIKEIHFFSRDRFEKGREWYEAQLSECDDDRKKGEFSTSYLFHPEAAARINAMYPEVKLICIIRNPIDRAYSQYRNAIKAMEIDKHTTFEQYLGKESSALEQGLYYQQLQRYFQYFSYKQFHLAVYEDIKKDPEAFMKAIYTFLGVDPEFRPVMLKRLINTARTPKLRFIERVMHWLAEWMRRHRLGSIVWFVKKSGLSDLVRKFNTEPEPEQKPEAPLPYNRSVLVEYFKQDVALLSQMLQRNLSEEWDIK